MENALFIICITCSFLLGYAFGVAHYSKKSEQTEKSSNLSKACPKKPPLYEVSKKYGNIYALDLRWNKDVCQWHYDIIYTAPNGNVGAGDVFETRLTELINAQNKEQ